MSSACVKAQKGRAARVCGQPTQSPPALAGPFASRRDFLRAAVVGPATLSLAPARFFAAETSRRTSGALAIDLSQPGVRFNRMLFGQFLEHFHRQVYGGVFDPGSPLVADERGFRKDVIMALRQLQVPIVRWPGGCFVSSYHWKEGVGKDRQPSFDKAWGVEDPNTFGTDEYVLWCRAIGAEPYVCTNADLLEPNVLPARISCETLQNGDASVPVVDAVATLSDDKKRVTLTSVNRHPDRAVDLKLDLGAMPAGAKVKATVLAGDSPDAYNDVTYPDRVQPEVREGILKGASVSLSPHSVSIIQVLL